MSQSNVIRVLIVDDRPIVRQGLAAVIFKEPDMLVTAQAENGVEAIELFRQEQPDVTLMDLRMPQMGGVEAITAISLSLTTLRIIVLTTFDGDEDIYTQLASRCKGVSARGSRTERTPNRYSHGLQRATVYSI